MIMEHITFDYQNPYSYYHHLRKHSPVYQDMNDTYFLSRYADVKLLLSDQRFTRQSLDNKNFISYNPLDSQVGNIISKWIMLNDAPRHTYLRNLLSTLFDAGFIKSTKILMENIAEKLLITLLTHDEVDFMQMFACPYAVIILNQLFGVDLDVNTTRKWSRCVSTVLDHGTEEDYKILGRELLMMHDYFSELINKRSKVDNNNWMDKLIYLEKSKQLSHDDVVATCIFLMLTGQETVQMTLGLGTMTLLKHLPQLNLLQHRPELTPSAIEEILRYESPFSLISRWTSEEITILDTIIPKNKLVVGIINSANRDEAQFFNPDAFDIMRSPNKHIAFGRGIHQCLGGLLARIGLNVAFSILTPELHRLTLLEEKIKWLPNASFRYIDSLPIYIQNKPSFS